jgi:hypothetical protein
MKDSAELTEDHLEEVVDGLSVIRCYGREHQLSVR